MKDRSILIGSIAAGMLAVSSTASADLIGTTATLDSYYPDLGATPVSWGPVVVADPGVEFPDVFNAVWTSDITASTVRLDQLAGGNLLGPADFNGFVYTFAGLSTPIDTIELDASSTLVPTNMWATGNQIFLDYADAGRVEVSFTMVNVTFVPSPGTAAVFGAVGMLGVRRRR